MNEIEGPLAEWLADRVPKLASQSHRRFPMVPAEDFEQAIWLRALTRQAKLAKNLRDGNEGFVWTELRSAATKLGKEDDRYRRACKAAAAGYRTFDEEFYSAGTIALLLTALLGAEENVGSVIEQATQNTDAAGVHIRASDPGAVDNYLVMLIDVQAAFERLPEGSRRLLRQYYGLPVEDTEEGRWERRKLASSMGLTYEALRRRVSRAVSALQDELGGASPWRREDIEAEAA